MLLRFNTPISAQILHGSLKSVVPLLWAKGISRLSTLIEVEHVVWSNTNHMDLMVCLLGWQSRADHYALWQGLQHARQSARWLLAKMHRAAMSMVLCTV